MTTREDFERKVTLIAKEHNYAFQGSLLKRDGDDYSTTWVDMMWEGYQACAAHYEATINTLNDAITEEGIMAKMYADLEADRNALLALIAEKDKALRQVKSAAMGFGPNDNGKRMHAALVESVQISDSALSLTHDSVRLVEAAVAMYDTADENNKAAFLLDDEDLEEVKKHPTARSVKLYTIVKGE